MIVVDIEYLFPFESINRDERIIIYGAGKVCRSFLHQIEMSSYCSVVAIVDNQSDIIESSYDIKPIDYVIYMKYDKILIAVNNLQQAEAIGDNLVNLYGVDESKIVFGSGRKLENRDNLIWSRPLLESKIGIAFIMSGGFGDCIVGKKFVCSFLELVPTDICHVDIYCSIEAEFVSTLFSDVKIYSVSDRVPRHAELARYDIVINPTNIVRFFHFNYEKVRGLQPKFADSVRKLAKYWDKYLSFNNEYEMGIHFARCKLMGYNAYTAYNMGGVVQIIDTFVNVPLLESFTEKYGCLNLPPRYITINREWGDSERFTKAPAKIWPIKHYERFIELFHSVFPDIKVVQLGQEHSGRLIGADEYIFGEHIETVKFILKNAVFHLDSEGGLVHIATQLGTKCVVLFGPTPVHYFGYKQNLNIVSDVCENCYYLDNDFRKCIRDLEHPECMESILPDRVIEYVKDLDEMK